MHVTPIGARSSWTRLTRRRGSTWAGCSRRADASPRPRRTTGRCSRALQPWPTALFNLGTALEDLGRTGEAIAAYRETIAADAAFADAHFNLARLYERTGRRAAAIRHFRAYRDLME
ncbi:MAG: tetratricopeptide repeat protein [Gemmatimonadales bacterium]